MNDNPRRAVFGAAAALALAFLTLGMLIMGVMFATLWVVCFVLGRRLEAQHVRQ